MHSLELVETQKIHCFSKHREPYRFVVRARGYRGESKSLFSSNLQLSRKRNM